ncbi:MAG TPA: phage major capsid protein, partial [Pirellulales bacterium]
MDPNKLREERAAKINKARELRDKAAGEKRSLNTEERAQLDSLMKAAEDLLAQAKQLETLAAAEQSLDDPATEGNGAPPAGGDPGAGGTRSHKKGQPTKTGPDGATPNTPEYRAAQRRNTPEYRSAFRRWCVDGTAAFSPEERRDLSANNDVQGGYMVAPEQFMTELIAAIEDECILRGLVRVINLKGAGSISAPTKTSRMSDAEWTSEVATGSKDTALAFGKRSLTPHPLAKRALVSETLLRLSALPADSIVMQAIAEVVGIALENG